MELIEAMGEVLHDKRGQVIDLHDRVLVDLGDGPQLGIVKAGNTTEAFVEVRERKVLPFIAASLTKCPPLSAELTAQLTGEYPCEKCGQTTLHDAPQDIVFAEAINAHDLAELPDYEPARTRVSQAVLAERASQDQLWGEQHHTPHEWMSILTEEVGEAAEWANKQHWTEDPDKANHYKRALLQELIQVAAVAQAAVEDLDNRAE